MSGKYVEYLREHGRKETTLTNNQRYLERCSYYISTRYGDIMLDDIDESVVHQIVTDMRQDMSEASVKAYVRTMG